MYLLRRRRTSRIIIACLCMFIIGLLLRKDSSATPEGAVRNCEVSTVSAVSGNNFGTAGYSSSVDSRPKSKTSVASLLSKVINESAVKATVDELFKVCSKLIGGNFAVKKRYRPKVKLTILIEMFKIICI